MRLERVEEPGLGVWLSATDRSPHFPFVALAHLLFSHFRATEVVPFTRSPDEALLIVALPDGLVVRLSHHKDLGTTLRPRDATFAAQFEQFAAGLARMELPTRWTPMHPSTIELGRDLPGLPAPSPRWAWLRGLWSWLRAV